MFNTILLVILDLFVVFYLFKALLPETRKSYFKREISKIKKQIWDQEFKIEKTQQIREGVRRDRDNLIDARSRLDTAFKATPNDKKIEGDLKEVNDTIKRYEAQMKMLDDRIQGVPAKADDPGMEGMNDTIASLAELKSMYVQYLSNL